jgi:16S rRNA (cytosine967-C5)-methyltransferase
VAERRAGVQDEGSQLVAEALADAPLQGPDRRWLDLCAGPGGKSALLAALAGPRGARLLASERLAHRAALVAVATSRAGDGLLGVLSADGTRPAWRARSFDRVLVDAPCTGLGALRRRPEARWRRAPADVEPLVMLQRSLLAASVDSVRRGGVVAYVTCSPVLAETRDVVSAVLAERDDVLLQDAAPLFERLPDSAGPMPGTVQLWPHRHGTDAMFLALLRRS